MVLSENVKSNIQCCIVYEKYAICGGIQSTVTKTCPLR
uniref:Uncharacterized protein n=1 Tax=Anguilla anguilla TaxID=7936 RepID=A0A0E9TVV2_ANGAN